MERRRPPQGCSLLRMIKKAACLDESSADTGKGKNKFKSQLCTNKVSHGFHLVEGQSGHDMEDYHFAEYRKKKGHVLGLFAIYDGHLGDRVPSYLKENLFDNILEEQNFFEDPKTAIKNAYHSTDKVILEKSLQLGPGGSTAVTAIVIDGKDLWVANIGDSRAVICRGGVADQLSVDHEPHIERRRIEKQGGFVTTLPGDVPRVNGQLAVARAFGDENLKAHLSSEPDVRNVMSNQEAVDMIRHIRDPQSAAKRLTTEALARKSKDDISCIVIRFG
ncbi:hypothetical protein RD792_014492 [Penstemon davidsonii]|uniref:PPM-type phosphatase domain-containing protein n=1 Tax=Penstemon davidsonii TaxID=160366 RepID=A0ABR0CQ09_9LAMI|nr:hypothetical protein RD792_014492 [Penstemon davidsonii]